jgi:hypothetical protein
MSLTIEQLTITLNLLKKFRLNANQGLFEEVFGKEIGEHYWLKFSQAYHHDLVGFWGYLDGAYKNVLLNYLTVTPKKTTEA